MDTPYPLRADCNAAPAEIFTIITQPGCCCSLFRNFRGDRKKQRIERGRQLDDALQPLPQRRAASLCYLLLGLSMTFCKLQQ